MKKQFRMLISLTLVFTLLAMNMPAYVFAESGNVGYINTIAGNGTGGYSGDGGPATEAKISSPYSVAVDASGNIYFADFAQNVIREIAAETHTQWGIAMTAGNIYTIAGNGLLGSGDGGPATEAGIGNPEGIAVDTAGNLYIVDTVGARIREIAAETHTQWGIAMTSGYIYTVAGGGSSTGTNSIFGPEDNVAATCAQLAPTGVAVDTAGNLYIASMWANMIYEVAASDGTQRGIPMKAGNIYTVAGILGNGYSGDGGPATGAQLNSPVSVAVDTLGNLFITDSRNHVIRKVHTSGIITTVAGSGAAGNSGDGGSATDAKLGDPYGVAVDASGNIYIADNENNVVREVAAVTGMQWGISMMAGYIYTVAGTGTGGYSGDGGPATAAALRWDTGVALDSAGNLYIADYSNHCIRKVTTTLPLSAAETLTTLPAGTVNSGYDSGSITQYVNVSGGTMPYTWSAEGLPGGLSMNSDGRITGTPDGAFSGSITVTVADSSATAAQTANVSLPMTVNPAPPVIDPDGGTYDRPQTVNVTISTSLSGGQSIYYTTDNTTPTGTSALYTEPFSLALASGATTVKACVYDSGTNLWSSLASACFKVVTTPAPPITSTPSAEPGTKSGTTKITVSSLNNKDDTLAVKISASSIDIPNLGDNPPNGDKVVNPYISGGDLSAEVSDYVGIFELDSSGKVAAFSQLKLSADDILTPTVSVSINPTASTAGNPGTVSVTVATNNVADDQSVTACLTDSGRNILNSVAMAEGKIHDSTAALSLKLPGTLTPGNYYVSVTISGIPSIYKLYTIQVPPPPPPPIIIISAPIASTGAATGITGYNATLKGSILYDGGTVCTNVSFMYRKLGDSIWQPAAAQSVSLTSGAQFSTMLKGLTPHTTYEYFALAINSMGSGSGQTSTFTTAALPAVITQTPTSLSRDGVTFNGTIKDYGDSQIIDCGFIAGPSSAWENYNGGTPPSGTWNFPVQPGADGSFTVSSYWVDGAWSYLAYATNAGGTSYGSLKSFKVPSMIVTTLKANAVGSHTATLYGNFTGGDRPVKTCGFQWGTDPGNLQQVPVVAGKDGSFSINLTGLKSDTKYIFRAYGENEIGDLSGSMLDFTTLTDAPVVETKSITGLSGTEATLKGNIVKDNNLPVTESGFLWGTSPKPDTKVSIYPDSDGHSLYYVLKGLAGGTAYYVKAYAVNSAGTGYGDVIRFVTPSLAPVVETQSVKGLTATTATLKGFITNNNGMKITDSGFMWGSTPEPDTMVRVPAGSDGFSLSYNLKELNGSTTYYVRAYAVNSAGTGYGDVLSFTTKSRAPDVITQAVTGVRDNIVKFNGYIKNNNGLPITASGFMWGLNPQPENKLFRSPGSDGRTLTDIMGGFEGGSTVYVRAFAANSDGYGLGDVMSFTIPVMAPAVSTTSAVFDNPTYSLSLKGKITSDGGALLAGYGFRYSTDQKNWTTLILGQGNYTGDITASIDGQKNGLKPGTVYYVQAFAANTAGTTYGKTVTFKTLGLPKLTADIDKSGITTTTATLNGTITDTGGTDIPVTAYRFMYRQAGSKDWLVVDSTQGSFGKVSFSSKLEGLAPGMKYEFEAQACSIAGWGNSQTVSFAASWGSTDKEVAVNMKAAGYGADVIATAIRSTFKDSDTAAFEVLRYAGFEVNDIAAGLKNSSYKDSAARLTDIFYTAGISADSTAGMLQQVFHWDMSILSFGRDKPGPAPLGVAITLNKGGYKLDEIITGLKTFYNFQPADFMNSYGLDLTDDPFGYSSDEIYSAFARVYGADTLTRYLWNTWNSYGYGDKKKILMSIAGILKRDAGIGSAQEIGELLKNIYPSMSMAQLAGACKDAGYRASETGAALMQVYNTADLQTIVFNLLNNTSGPYDTAEIEDFMVKDLSCSAKQFVQVITAINIKGNGSIWVSTKKIPGLLTSYYQMNAQEAARTMYESGYTEAKDGTGYGFINLIYALLDSYHPASFYELIGILKDCGASPLAVAQGMYSLLGTRNNLSGDWLIAYQEQGYTAIDAAAWCASTGKNYYGDIASTIYGLLPAYYRAKNSSQGSLNEIALAIKTVYNPDAATALNNFESVNRSYNLGLADSDIQNAITYAYQTDALTVIIKTMKDAGASATQVAHTLNQRFGIKDQMKMAGYLAGAGYDVGDVVTALDDVFYYDNRDSKAAIDALSQAGLSAFPQNPPSLGLILKSIGCSTAASAVYTLNKDGYSIKDTAIVLKDSYSRTVLQALWDIIGILGRDKHQQITQEVLEAYGLDETGFVLYLKSAGYSASQALDTLKNQCGISNLDILASCLNKAGYSEIDVLTAFTPPGITDLGKIPGHLNTQLAAAVSAAYGNDAILVYMQYWKGLGLKVYFAANEIKLAGIADLNKQASYLAQIGYEALEAFVAMKQANTESELRDIIAAVASAYGKDSVIFAILIWQSQGTTYPDTIYRLMDSELGIVDPVQRFNYMKEAGYSDFDAFAGVVRYSRNDLIKVIINAYELSDPIAVGNQFRQLPEYESKYYRIDDMVSMLQQAFPGISNVTQIKTISAAGFPTYSNGDSLFGYLRSHFDKGQKDDALVAILGTGSEDSLGLKCDDATVIIHGMGYDLKEAVALLLKDNYTWPQIFYPIRNLYGSYNKTSAWGVWNSDAIPVLKALMDTYDIVDLVNGDLSSYSRMFGITAATAMCYADVYNDLIAVGYVQEDAIRVMLKAGASLTDLFSAAYDPSKSAADIANVFWNVAATDKWKKVNAQPYDTNISVLDIAKAMINAGSFNGRKFQYYTLNHTFDAMKSVAGKYMQAINVTDVPSNVAALLIMREAGMSADNAASITYYEENSKNYSIWEALFNGPNPIAAIGELVQAGYGKNESISAVWNNPGWNLVTKIQISSMLNIAASSEELAEDVTMFERIVAAIAPDIEGGIMVTTVSKLGIAKGLYKIISSGISLGNAINSDKASLIVISSLTPDKASPQRAGTTITWTCTAKGISGELEYEFQVVPKSDSLKAAMGVFTSDQLGQAYGKSNTFTWKPTAAGDYIIIVRVRDSGSSDTKVQTAPASFTVY